MMKIGYRLRDRRLILLFHNAVVLFSAPITAVYSSFTVLFLFLVTLLGKEVIVRLECDF